MGDWSPFPHNRHKKFRFPAYLLESFLLLSTARLPASAHREAFYFSEHTPEILVVSSPFLLRGVLSARKTGQLANFSANLANFSKKMDGGTQSGQFGGQFLAAANSFRPQIGHSAKSSGARRATGG